MTDRVWISWNEQRRNIGLAAAVGARLYMTERDSPGWLRLFQEFCESWKIILREKPRICFTMNPSIFSSWWLSILAKIYQFRLVTDLHTPNIKLYGLKKIMCNMILNSGIRRSDIVIVTNNLYREAVLELNPNVVIVPDPLPVLRNSEGEVDKYSENEDKKMKILLVSSFDDDEPINEVLALDLKLNEFSILVTGNWKKKFYSPPDTKNIRFLGFISSREYERLLLSVDGVIVLTSSEGCLCCGAYEAFSAGKPLILSRTKALQEFFGKAPIYTENVSGSILKALRTLKKEAAERAQMIALERERLRGAFEKGINNLERMIAGLK